MEQKTLTDQIEDLQKSLQGSAEVAGDNAIRMAIFKQAISAMSDDEKKEARSILGAGEDEKEKEGSNKEAVSDGTNEQKEGMGNPTAPNETINGPKGGNELSEEIKKAMEEKDKQIASLTASVNYLSATPMIEAMLTARRNVGVDEKDISSFKSSLYGKSPKEIESIYNSEKALYASNRSRGGFTITPPTESVSNVSNIPFNGGNLEASGDDAGKTLEELLV